MATQGSGVFLPCPRRVAETRPNERMRAYLVCLFALLSSVAASPLNALKVVGRPVAKLGTAYRGALKSQPFVTNVVTMGSLFTASDLLAQTAVEKKSLGKVDRVRLRNAAIVGGVYSGICVPQIYQFMDKLGSAMVKGAQKGKRATLIKAAMTTSVLCSLGNGSNMVGRLLLEGKSLRQALDEVRPKMPEVIKYDISIWPFYDVLCFSVIPPEIRGVTTGSMSCLWNTYLSFTAHK